MAKSSSKKEKTKHRTLKHNKNKYAIKSDPSTLRIINKSKESFDKILKTQKEYPLLNRLFRKENVEKLQSMPKESTDISKYSTVLNKEFKQLKQNKQNQPNQDFYSYVNQQWLKDETQKLKKVPKYYVEVDDFRIVQDKVYREVMKYTDTYIKENPSSKKAKSIKAVANCIQKASKNKRATPLSRNFKRSKSFHRRREHVWSLSLHKSGRDIFLAIAHCLVHYARRKKRTKIHQSSQSSAIRHIRLFHLYRRPKRRPKDKKLQKRIQRKVL